MTTKPGPDARDADERARVQRRTLRVLVAGQVLGGVGLAAGVAVGALLARDLLDGDSFAGLPVAVAAVGGALAAPMLARLMDRRGRRPGLGLGYLLGAIGSCIVVVAATAGSFALLLAGMVLFGAGNTSSLAARFAGADLALPGRRGQALSTVLFATTFGAVAGPNLIDATGAAADALGLPELSGPFGLSAIAYAAAALTVWLLLRPDPLVLARRIDAAASPPVPVPHPGRGGWADLSHGPALTGVTGMVAASMVMVGVMTVTPLHMRAHDHGLTVIGLVLSIHIAGMYLFSPLVGMLCDRLGRLPTLRTGAVTLAASGVLAATADPASSVVLGVALFLLGLGWSFCMVAGSTLIVDAVPPSRRPQAQGDADLLLGLFGAAGGLGSGVLLGAASFAAVALLAIVISVVFLGPRWIRDIGAPADAAV